MITKDKVTEIFCIIDEFDKNLSAEFAKNLRLPSHNSDGKRWKSHSTLTLLAKQDCPPWP